MFSFSGQIATLILRLDLHSTGKNSTRCPVSRWKWGQCLERSDCTLSLMMLVLRMMVVSSMTWPTPCTTNTMCVMSGSRSETAKGREGVLTHITYLCEIGSHSHQRQRLTSASHQPNPIRCNMIVALIAVQEQEWQSEWSHNLGPCSIAPKFSQIWI